MVPALSRQLFTRFSGETGTRNLGFGYPQYCCEMGWRQVEQGFSSFFAKCLLFDDFSKWSLPKKILQNLEKSSNTYSKNLGKMNYFYYYFNARFGTKIVHSDIANDHLATPISKFGSSSNYNDSRTMTEQGKMEFNYVF